jgi:hypothetical protein
MLCYFACLLTLIPITMLGLFLPKRGPIINTSDLVLLRINSLSSKKVMHTLKVCYKASFDFAAKMRSSANPTFIYKSCILSSL